MNPWYKQFITGYSQSRPVDAGACARSDLLVRRVSRLGDCVDHPRQEPLVLVPVLIPATPASEHARILVRLMAQTASAKESILALSEDLERLCGALQEEQDEDAQKSLIQRIITIVLCIGFGRLF